VLLRLPHVGLSLFFLCACQSFGASPPSCMFIVPRGGCLRVLARFGVGAPARCVRRGRGGREAGSSHVTHVDLIFEAVTAMTPLWVGGGAQQRWGSSNCVRRRHNAQDAAGAPPVYRDAHRDVRTWYFRA
jgi:hypothetical protein